MYRSKRIKLMVEACLENILSCDEYGNIYKGEFIEKEHPDYDGYRAIYIKGVEIPCHQIIAFIKFGAEAIQEGIVTRHLNGKQLDNSWDNIAIGTPRDNFEDISIEIRDYRVSKIKEYWASLSVEERSVRNKNLCSKIPKEIQSMRGKKGYSVLKKNSRGKFLPKGQVE